MEAASSLSMAALPCRPFAFCQQALVCSSLSLSRTWDALLCKFAPAADCLVLLGNLEMWGFNDEGRV